MRPHEKPLTRLLIRLYANIWTPLVVWILIIVPCALLLKFLIGLFIPVEGVVKATVWVSGALIPFILLSFLQHKYGNYSDDFKELDSVLAQLEKNFSESASLAASQICTILRAESGAWYDLF